MRYPRLRITRSTAQFGRLWGFGLVWENKDWVHFPIKYHGFWGSLREAWGHRRWVLMARRTKDGQRDNARRLLLSQISFSARLRKLLDISTTKED